MKLSVKLITALAAFVLLVVGLVGLTSSSSTARAAVDGKVYVANEWSKLTNDPTPMTGYTYAGASKTIYSTFVEVNAAAGAAQNTIQTNSDVVTIFVEDADVNVAVAKTVVAVDGSIIAANGAVGTTQVVVLTTAESPIVDSDGDGIVSDNVTITGTSAALVAVSAATAGSSTVPATVTLVQTTAVDPLTASITLGWNTSAVNTVVVKVATTQNTTGKTFTISETAASSGIFKGSIDLQDVQDSAASATEIEIQNSGILTVTYSDATPKTGATAKSVTSTATAESVAPVVTVTSPTNASATQVLRPAFAGSVTDSTSGLDVSNVLVFIDETDDALDAADVAATKGSAVDVNTPTLPAGSADGATSTTFTLTPAANLPKEYTGSTPDHTVDWQVQASDLAGNMGWSDSKTSGSGSDNVAGRGQDNTVKIDRTLPGISNAYTGFALNSTVSPAVRKVNQSKSIEVNFNDNIDAATITNTDFEVVIGAVTHVPAEAAVGGTGFLDSVFLTMTDALATKDAPTVKIVGAIADAAGNTTSTGSKVGKDAMAPTVTVALSGGSSATAPATLTKLAMTITITSDEGLSADPVVQIYDGADAVHVEGTVTAVNQGSNTWIASFSGGSYGGGGAGDLDGQKKSVVVTANDSAALTAVANAVDGLAVPAGTVVGQKVAGKADDAATGAITFTLDKTAPTLTLSPSGSTSDASPFVRWDFGEKVTVSKAEFGVSSATLTDVTAELGTSDTKVYVRATSDLALGTYKATGTATDLAGNKATGLSSTFVIAKRADFKMTVLPGTTLVSFPLDPADTSINAVFSPAGIVSVSSYDTATGAFSSAVRDESSGELAGDLASVESGVGYVVVADAVSALVVPIPSLNASSIPPSIPIDIGWNLVGVTDVTGGAGGALQQPGSTIATGELYFPTKVTQVYSWNATSKVWQGLMTRGVGDGGANVIAGEAYWAYTTAAQVIVP